MSPLYTWISLRWIKQLIEKKIQPIEAITHLTFKSFQDRKIPNEERRRITRASSKTTTWIKGWPSPRWIRSARHALRWNLLPPKFTFRQIHPSNEILLEPPFSAAKTSDRARRSEMRNSLRGSKPCKSLSLSTPTSQAVPKVQVSTNHTDKRKNYLSNYWQLVDWPIVLRLDMLLIANLTKKLKKKDLKPNRNRTSETRTVPCLWATMLIMI